MWMACRTGVNCDRQAHGEQGYVRLFSAETRMPDAWKDHGVLFKPAEKGTRNELDAILSAPAENVFFLMTRDYEYGTRNDVYISRTDRLPVTHRTRLTAVSDQNAIGFGHIRKAHSNMFLMPGYSGLPDEPEGAPVLLASRDEGISWQLRSIVASSTGIGTRLTEYSMGRLGAGRWIALIRNETPPYELHAARTGDDGLTWSKPVKTDLLGHAPMILETRESGTLLVIYRDLSESDPGVAIGVTEDGGNTWQHIGRLCSYTGSIYDGGYGDLVELDDGEYLAVYYTCDDDASPWIEGVVFTR